MYHERVKGLASAYAAFAAIPDAARDQLGVELAIIGRDILAMQQQAVAKDTGALEQGLSIALLIEKLRVRIGLLANSSGGSKSNGRRSKMNYGGYYYGRFVEFGRKAQTVLVTRTARRKANRLSTKGARRAAVLANSYSMKVSALKPRPFVRLPGVQQVALGQLAEFWSRTLARSGVST